MPSELDLLQGLLDSAPSEGSDHAACRSWREEVLGVLRATLGNDHPAVGNVALIGLERRFRATSAATVRAPEAQQRRRQEAVRFRVHAVGQIVAAVEGAVAEVAARERLAATPWRPRDLVPARVRRHFRELASGAGTLRSIEEAFEDEGFEPVRPAPRDLEKDGQRRGRFDLYATGIDWSDPEAARRALRVFEQFLSWVNTQYPGGETVYREAISKLERDGFAVDEATGSIAPPWSRPTAVELPLESLTDAAAIEVHLQRLDEIGDSDPVLAIGQAKALVEATSKTVLTELGETFEEQSDLPALVRATQKALGVHRDDVAPTAKGAESIRRTLSALTQIVLGIAELRNEHPSDKGRSRPATTGLGPRHAHLAVGAAQTYCRFILQTARDRNHRA